MWWGGWYFKRKEGFMAKNKVNAKQFAADIKQGGFTDEQLLEKYQIGRQSTLENLLGKLVSNGLATQADIDNRHKVKFEAKEIEKPKIKPKPVPTKKKEKKGTWERVKKGAKQSLETDSYKIIGGSFGLKGSLVVHNDMFNVYSTQEVQFNREHVQDILLSKGEKKRKFSIFSFIIGFIVTVIISFLAGIVSLGILFWFVFIIGIVISIVGSFYSSKDKDTGTILLNDGKRIEVTGQLDRLLVV